MRYKVNENCIGCGQCAGICPDVFSMTADGYARASSEDVQGETDEEAKRAADNCPVSAIESES